ncbi:transposase [Bacillus phage vB_BceH_LY2]|nr:transposase [Bacillus phage vB_BceH_LY2]
MNELTSESIGIDLGIKDLAIVSNLDKPIKNINKTKKMKQLEKKLHRLQRSCARKYKMNNEVDKYNKTNNIVEIEKKIKLVYRKMTNIRLNHIHQATAMIIKTKPSRVVMETLNVKGMTKNRHLAKALQEQKLYEFKYQMKYKCEFNGIELVEADRFFPSSKMCSCCGNVKKTLKLRERTYRCEECGLVEDRDKNASINLANYNLVN